MPNLEKPGKYLIVEFNWPAEVDKETALLARKLHDLVEQAD